MQTKMKFLKKITIHPAVFPVFLLFVLFLAYGYQITRMGFYWDDWQLVYLVNLNDPQVFWGYYAFDRPIAAWLYVLISPVLGINPIAWQLFSLLFRWIGCLGFYYLFQMVWPERKMESGFAALLLAVYPGFTQQPISVTYSLFWVLYALFLWSFWASIKAIRQPGPMALPLTIFAILASLMEALSMEYVIGLELLRPVLFLFVLVQMGNGFLPAVKKALLRWIPYFLVLVVFAYFRFVYFPSIHTDPEANAPLLLREILHNPAVGIPRLIQNVLQDLSQVLVFVWGKPIIPAEIDLGQTTNWIAFIVGIVIAVVSLVMLHFSHSQTYEMGLDTTKNYIPAQMIWFGLVAVIMGGLPVWSTNRQVIVGMWSDRFALSLMFGAVIFITGFAAWLSQRPLQKGVFLSIFLALGMAFQIQNTARYKLNWDAQRDYYWQLIWRAPHLTPGTAVLGNKVPFGLSAEYSIGFALNTIYKSTDLEKLPYWFFSAVSDRGGSIPDYLEGIPLKFNLRSVNFESDTSNGLAVYYKYGQSCLRVMTPAEKRFPNLDDNESELLAISHPSQIILSEPQPLLPEALFGSEPKRTWCYYFQKADLSRQMKDWDSVLNIMAEAEQRGFGPRNGTEFVPAIEANAKMGNWPEALTYTLNGLELSGSAKPYFCDIWQGLVMTSDDNPTALERLAVLECED
jgi:hypothetical protein